MTPTDEQITAAARVLSNDNADVCNVNREDNWNIYGDSFIETARVALEAAFNVSAPAVDGARDEAQWEALAERHANRDWNGDAYLESVKALCADYARAALSASTEAAAESDVQWEAHLLEAVQLTIDTLGRQLDLIADRAPGNFLDKVPVVRSLTAHKIRLERAVAERNASFAAHPTASRTKLTKDQLEAISMAIDWAPHGSQCEKVLLNLLQSADSATASDKEGA